MTTLERTDKERLAEAQSLVDRHIHGNLRSALQAIAMREGRWVDRLGPPDGPGLFGPTPEERSTAPLKL